MAGCKKPGHTEYLAARSGGHPVMMLACPGLRVALATTHLPLRKVADAIDRAKPWGVDASSGLESAPGTKDLNLIIRFVEEAKSA